MSLSEPELKTLMLASLDGDAAAYRRRLEGSRARLNGYSRRRLEGDPAHAEDLAQETLMAIDTKRAAFDPLDR